MNDLEGLIIYKTYMNLLYYTESIVIKFPKCEKMSLVSTIKTITYDGMRCLIIANKEFDKHKRLDFLNELDVYLKMIKVLVRISLKNKYINYSNYKAWSRKLTDVNNLTLGWIKSCVKQ